MIGNMIGGTLPKGVRCVSRLLQWLCSTSRLVRHRPPRSGRCPSIQAQATSSRSVRPTAAGMRTTRLRIGPAAMGTGSAAAASAIHRSSAQSTIAAMPVAASRQVRAAREAIIGVAGDSGTRAGNAPR